MSPTDDNKPDRRRGPRTTVTTNTVPPVTPEPEANIDDLKAKIRAEVMAELKAQAQTDAEVNKTVAEAPPDPLTPAEPDEEGAVTVHFVEDGMTWLGQSWYTGQQLTVKPDTKEWKELTDPKTGRLLLTLSENEQILKWGRRMFRPGTWIGQGFDLDDPNLTDEERARLASIQQKRDQLSLAPGAPAKRRLFNN